MYIRDRYFDDKQVKQAALGAFAAVLGIIFLFVSFGGGSASRLDAQTLAASDKLINQLQENQNSSTETVPEDPAHAVMGDGAGNRAITPD